MCQMKGILQFAPVLIRKILVIIRWYKFCCVDYYNHVNYTAHIFWSRYAYSGKHHACLEVVMWQYFSFKTTTKLANKNNIL